MKKDLDAIKHAYFLGIGGIGMSALARYCQHKNIAISGYDRDRTELTKKLEAEGMDILYHIDTSSVPKNIDIVVYTPAVQKHHPLFAFFEAANVPIIKRSEALALVLHGKKVIAVAGTHGKTSTSAILGHILTEGGIDITAFVGGIMNNYDTNFLYGNSKWVVVEADEYDRSFLRISPTIAIIQAIDPDHLDIYGSEAAMERSYKTFTEGIVPGGSLWVHKNVESGRIGKRWHSDLVSRQVELRTFGKEARGIDLPFRNLCQEIRTTTFEMKMDGRWIKANMQVPGEYNVNNALGAAAVARQLGIKPGRIVEALSSFKGIKRRYEMVYLGDEKVIIDDYAHHPVEIESVIATVRAQFPGRHLTVVFQPHLFSRTRDFQREFAAALDRADRVIVTDIYPAREEPIPGVDSFVITRHMMLDDKTTINKNNLSDYLNTEDTDILLILGAGDIYKEIPLLQRKLVDV